MLKFPKRRVAPCNQSRRFLTRPVLMNLEDRAVPATFTVLNDGTGLDLAAQITALNASTDATNTLDLFTNFTSPSTLALATALPAITVPVDVIGGQTAGVNNVTIDAGGVFNLFDVSGAPAGAAISFQKLNMTKGISTTTGLAGVITVDSQTVTVSNSSITSSTAPVGGGIAVNGAGTINVVNSTISGNVATAGGFRGGGGIYAYDGTATVNIQRSTISGNSAGRGGAVILYFGGALTIEDSTISGNTSGVFGGAVYTFDLLTTFRVRNSTFSGNTAGSSGGAIAIIAGGALADIQNSTFTQNKAGGTDGGGGIAVLDNTGGATLQLSSNIISGNTHSSGSNSDLVVVTGNTVNASKNAIGVTSGFTLGTNTGNIFGSTNLQLDTQLKNNGGTVATHAILGISSVLVDAGENVGVPALVNDARGSGFDRTVGAGTDIGAFEFKAPTFPTVQGTFANITTLSGGGTSSTKLTVTYTAPAGEKINTATLDSNDLLVTGPSFSQLAGYPGTFSDPNGDQTKIVVTYNLPANPTGTPNWDFQDNGTYTVAMQGSQVKTLLGTSVPAGTVGTFTVSVGKTYVVDNATDIPVVGKLSLREAFANATAETPGALDIINYDAAVFATPQTITVDTPLLINSDVIANAPASRITITSAVPGTRPLTMDDGSNALTTASLSNLAFTGGSSTLGGGIYAGISDQLTLINCAVTGNSSTGSGGGIYIDFGGSLNLVNSTVSGNTSDGAGGGIYFYNTGSLNVQGSTVSGNVADEGGGIYFFGSSPQMLFVNSTLSGNSAISNGGGFAFRSGTSNNLQVINSTITNNTAANNGGGIARLSGTGTVTLSSSIVSGNTALTNNDIATTLVDSITSSFSAVGVDPGVAWNANNNLPAAKNLAFGTVLGLDPVLANNGGPTLTHNINAGSPLINAGTNSLGLATDQIGQARSLAGGVDIGAVERVAAGGPVVSGFIVNGNASPNSQRSRLTTIQINFASPVDLTQFQTAGAVILTRTGVATNNVEPNGTVVDISNGLVITPASGNGSSITLTFQNIDNAGIDNGSLSDGRWQISIPAAGFLSANTPADTQLRRLFGDIDNNGNVDAVDFSAFPAFGAVVGNQFDFDNNNDINAVDFAAFGGRNGYSLV